jgi:type I restriction enzyme S subunit
MTLADVWRLRGGTVDVVTETSEKISALGLENSAAVKHPAGTVILSRTASVGFSAILGADMATSQDFATWTCDELLDPRYLLYALRAMAPDLRRLVEGSTHKTVYMPDIAELRIPLPPGDTQSRIVSYLDANVRRLDQLVAKKLQMADLLKERRSGLIESAIRGVAVNGGEGPLRFLARELTVGIVITPAAWYADTGVPALRGVNVFPGRIDLNDLVYLTPEGHRLHRKSKLEAGDVVVVRTGQAGSAAVVPAELDGANCIDLIIIRPGPRLDPGFLVYVLSSDFTQKHIDQYAVGSIQSHFNLGAMKSLPIPTIAVSVQRAIVARLDVVTSRIDHTLNLLQRQISVLRERRQALITFTVTGQRDISGTAA